MLKKINCNLFYWILAVLTVLFLFTACEQPTANGAHVFKNSTWAYSDSLDFEFENKDSSMRYDLFLDIRNNTEYAFSNLHVWVKITDPNEKVILNDKYEMKLADSDGKWTGGGFGKVYSNSYKVIYDSPLPLKGNYKIQLKHYMRPDSMTGLEDIGFRLVPAEIL